MFSELYKKDNLMITPSEELINQISENMKLEIKKSTKRKRIPIMRYTTAAVAVVEIIAAAVMIPIYVKNSDENLRLKSLSNVNEDLGIYETDNSNQEFSDEEDDIESEDDFDYDIAEDEVEESPFDAFIADLPPVDAGDKKRSDKNTDTAVEIESDIGVAKEDYTIDESADISSSAFFNYGYHKVRTDYDYKSYLYWAGSNLWDNLVSDNLIPPQEVDNLNSEENPNTDDKEELENSEAEVHGDGPVLDNSDSAEPAPDYIALYDPENDEPASDYDTGGGVYGDSADGSAGNVIMPELREDMANFKQFADEFFTSRHMIDYFSFPSEDYYPMFSILNIPELYSLIGKYINNEISYMDNDYRYLSYYNIQFSIMTEINVIDIYITPDDFMILRLRDNYIGAYILPLDTGTYNKMWNFLNTNYCR